MKSYSSFTNVCCGYVEWSFPLTLLNYVDRTVSCWKWWLMIEKYFKVFASINCLNIAVFSFRRKNLRNFSPIVRLFNQLEITIEVLVFPLFFWRRYLYLKVIVYVYKISFYLNWHELVMTSVKRQQKYSILLNRCSKIKRFPIVYVNIRYWYIN